MRPSGLHLKLPSPKATRTALVLVSLALGRSFTRVANGKMLVSAPESNLNGTCQFAMEIVSYQALTLLFCCFSLETELITTFFPV